MFKYYSKRFYGADPLEIEDWLNSMARPELSGAEGKDTEVVGYTQDRKENILITIRRWEMEK